MIREEPGIACFGCMNQECRETGLVTAINGTGRPLVPGQMVETDIPLAGAALEALFSLAPPFFVGAALFTAAAGAGLAENARAALGVLGLFASAAAIYLFRRKRPPASGPFVVRVLE
jgi:positive regulator of sigma E activity